jgi:monoamine oxidase
MDAPTTLLTDHRDAIGHGFIEGAVRSGVRAAREALTALGEPAGAG